MKIYSSLFLLGALGVLSAAGTAAAAVDISQWKCESCPYPKGTSGTVEVGVGAVSEASAKFGDYSGLQRNGAHLILGGELRYRGDSGYFADLSAADLGIGTRKLAAQTGREGLYSLRFGYAEVPRHFADDALTPFLGGGGDMLSLPSGYPAASTSSMPLASTLQPVALGYKNQRSNLGATWIAGENWTYRVGVRHDVRDGTRPTYGAFFVNASQLVAPVDQVTDQLEVSASYASRRLQAMLGYQISQFRNGPEALTWDNPFWPVVAGSSRGQLAQAPDNQFHQIVGSAGYQITPTIRASADVAVGRMTQNADYLASTLTPGLAATVPALPAASLDGRVDTFNGSVRLTAAPIDGLRLNASYTRDVRNNRTAIQSYPMVATDMFLDPATRSNVPFDSTQDRFKLSADYRGPGTSKLSAGVEQDNRQRSYQEVVDTRETTLWGRLGMQASDDVSLSLKLAHARRSHSTYGVSYWFGSPENPLLRKYYLAARQRNSAGLRADVALGEDMSLGLDADIAVDDYTESTVGLTYGRSAGIGADLSAAIGEKTQLQAFVRTDRMHSRQAGSEQAGQPDWWARNRDASDVVGMGVRYAAIADKLDLGADLTVTRSRSDVEVETLAAYPLFPSATTRMDSLRFFGTYRLRENLSLTGSFWHERYRSHDWRLDGVLPATLPNLLSLGVQPPQYSVNVVRVALRYGF